ncbi:signal peptidase I [Fodinicurvata sp. EGI_FJ10296]|uniref:signal peptidase I n=1 Tax=Fodinicurvata sp. EGI_FJ10296 TaxID=3231908 RepID=UPI003455AD73
MSSKKQGGIGDVIKTVVYAVLIALAVRTLAYEPFNIPSGSMIPTLLEGDYLFVSKFSYGYSYHTIAFGYPLFNGRIFGSDPERGDVAVFKLPSDPSVDYIKRIVGLPGDTVQVRDGSLYINDELIERTEVGQYELRDRFGRVESVTEYSEQLGDHSYSVLERTRNHFLDNTQVFEVPEDHYFAMGDNRDSSQDSRVLNAVGFIPEENLVGRAEFLWFSLDDARFWEIWRWPTAIRFDRLFTAIQ